MFDRIARITRYLLRLARNVKELQDKTAYQMGLIHKILEIQTTEIYELKAAVAQLEQRTCAKVAGSIPVSGSMIPCDDPKAYVKPSGTIDYAAIQRYLDDPAAPWESGCSYVKPKDATSWGTLVGE